MSQFQREAITDEILRRHLGLRVPRKQLEGCRNGCELETPLDIPPRLWRNRKVLDFQKDRDLFSTGRFHRRGIHTRPGTKFRGCLRPCHSPANPKGGDVKLMDDLFPDELSMRSAAQNPQAEPHLNEDDSFEPQVPPSISDSNDGLEPLYNTLPDNSWFRLLVIQPAEDEWADIQCKLQPIARKDARGKYEALSYAWNEEGDPRNEASTPEERAKYRRPCIVFGESEVLVKWNLWDALRRLRHPSRARAVWVDAVCINQNDPAEVAHQIQAMTEIYGQAHRTIVWLGIRLDSPHDKEYGLLDLPSAEAAMAIVCHVVKQWDPSQPAKYFVTNPTTHTEEAREVDTDSEFARNLDKVLEGPWAYDSPHKDALRPLQDLFSATWFGRKWVIQEVALSRSVDVLFRGCRISWRWIGLAAAIMRTGYDKAVRRFALYNVYHAYLMFRLSENNGLDRVDLSFPALLRLTAEFQTTEQKDRFFSLLGLRTRDHHPTLHPLFTGAEYHLSYPEVCSHIARAMLESGRSSLHPLSVLADAGISGSREMGNDVPSWVPTWRGKRPTLLSPWSLDDRFTADRGLEHYLDTSDTNRVSVQGIHISSVLRICDVVIEEEDEVAASIDWMDQFPATVPLLQVYSRTLCAGRNTEGRRENDHNAMMLPFVAFTMYGMIPGTKTYEWINTCRKLLPETDQNPWKDESKVTRTWNDNFVAARERFSCAAGLATPQRQLFVSISGHIGLGPGDLSPGDEIWVLRGAATPFILRPGSDGAKILVGPCYIDDMMDGEAVTAAKTGTRHLGPLWSEGFESESTNSLPKSFDVQRVVIQ
ncbi:heterokaryon incompatibility protein-domain-containing protein [Cercophora newfieldiana]|uniref:Heterokaryon incompatibility protein-domain-containing protein n=1 Tax=Cercophora newfieldiana TaxID=92897 RepID=A0AA39XSR3_9PEZI|nr:heterokaryon incompatibility protein-domain-containing protein [Cercophora newfieldiana]